MENEIWMPIRGYEEQYEISNMGNVKSLKRYIERLRGTGYWVKERIMILYKMKNKDYISVKLSKGGISKSFLVHVIVANHFVSNPFNLPEVDHDNFDRTDNRAVNLRWVTHDENIKRSAISGRMPGAKGEESPVSVLTNGLVLEIRKEYATGDYTYQQLADRFALKRNNISKIVLKQRWSHI